MSFYSKTPLTLTPNLFLTMSKVMLITGANRGIGFCIAQGIAQRLENCCILMGSRDLSASEDAIAKLRHLKATFEPIELDVTSDESIKACLEYIETKHGRLDGTSHGQPHLKANFH